MREQAIVVPRLGRAFTHQIEPMHEGFTVRAWSLDDPMTEQATRRIVHTRLLPEQAVHMAVIDGIVWIVTSLGYIERLTLDLTPIDSRQASWSATAACSADRRRLLVERAGGFALVDLVTDEETPFDLERADSDADSDAAALDASGSRLVYASFGRYSGRSSISWRQLHATAPQQELGLAIDDEVTQLCVAPAGGHAAAVLAGEQVVVIPVPWRDDDDHDNDNDNDASDDMLASVRAEELPTMWRRDSPGTVRAAFIDDRRIVLVGRGVASIRAVDDGVELAAIELDDQPIVDVVEGALWMRTRGGLRAIRLD